MKLCTNFTHASPPWLQHRDFGGSVTILSHYSPARLNRYSAPHTMNSRSLIVPVTLSHRVTTIIPLLSFSFIVKALSRSTELNPTSFSLVRATRKLSCRLLIFSQLIRLGIPIREQRKTLHVVIFSDPLSTECRSLDATVTPERGLVQVVIATCTQSKNSQSTRYSQLHMVWFSLMMAMRRKNCTNVSRQYDAFNITISCHSRSPEYHERLHFLSHVVDGFSSHASQSHAARLPCNLWFSCHNSPSWQV